MQAPTDMQTSLADCYRKHEAIKKRAYEQRVREVEHSSFTPLVLSATGGLATEAITFYKKLSACLADKWELHHPGLAPLPPYLLRSAIQCIRGARSRIGHASKAPPSIDLVTAEMDSTIISFLLFFINFYISNTSHV